MQQVRLAFKKDQREESERGVRISRYLKEMGLVMGRDYTWLLDTNRKEIVFMFNSEAESWATMLTMREF
mgnify:CR=1 FL=1|jgi:hypothetical protein